MEQAFSPDEPSISIFNRGVERLTREDMSQISMISPIEMQKKIDTMTPAIESINKKMTDLDDQYQTLSKRIVKTESELNTSLLEIQKIFSFFSNLTIQNDLKFKKLEEVFTKETLEVKLLISSQKDLKTTEKNESQVNSFLLETQKIFSAFSNLTIQNDLKFKRLEEILTKETFELKQQLFSQKDLKSTEKTSNPSESQDLQIKMKNFESLMHSLNSKTEKISEFMKNLSISQDQSKETSMSSYIYQYVQAIYSKVEVLSNSFQELQGKVSPSLEFVQEKVRTVHESLNCLRMIQDFQYEKMSNSIENLIRVSGQEIGNLSNREGSFKGSLLSGEGKNDYSSGRQACYFKNAQIYEEKKIEKN
jgi:hypothetical protein